MANKMIPYIQGTILKTRDGRFVELKIHTAEVAPGKQLDTGMAYSEAFRKKLSQFGRIDVLKMSINSRGGSFYSAAGCQDAIRRMQKAGQIGKVKILIEGLCGSAATLVAFSNYKDCEVCITPGSRVYIHMPKVYEYRRSGGIWSVIQKMGTRTAVRTFLELYRDRMKGVPKAEIQAWMEQGKSFNAGEAVSLGLCDRIATREQWNKE